MVTMVSPGVYVREVDLSTVVPAASTSLGAFVGNFNWGPAFQATTVSSESKLAEWFGKPTKATSATDFLTAASFLSYSGAIKIVRVVSESAKNAGKDGALDIQILNENQIEDGLDLDVQPGFFAKYPGSIGNSLKVIVIDSADWETIKTDKAAARAAVPPERYPAEDATEEQLDKYLAFSSFDSEPLEDEVHVLIVDKDGRFSGTVGTVLEKYGYVSKVAGAKKEDGSNNYIQEVITRSSSYINVGNVTEIESGIYPLSGGNDSLDGDPAVSDLTKADYIKGWDIFANQDDQEDVSLLIAGSADSLETSDVAKYVANIAINRTDCVAFISPPKEAVVGVTPSSQLDNVVNWRAEVLAIDTSYAFLDSGWKYVYNKYLDRYEWIPLCGDIAGLCARTDTTNDPWFSPAGYNRGNIKNCVKLAFNPDKAARDEMYTRGVNPVVNFRGTGPILYGDKTLQTRPSAFDRINVRRLFIVLERVISKASKYQLFEFNDQFTRAQFVNIVEPFLRDVQARRGIYDYKVVADETNNTPQVIDSNTFVGDIYIKPARSINFIQLSFVAVRTGVSFTEVVGKF